MMLSPWPLRRFPDGNLDLVLSFQNAIFGILPASVVLCVMIAKWLRHESQTTASNKSRNSLALWYLVILMPASIISLALFITLPADSEIVDPTGLAARICRTTVAIGSFIQFWINCSGLDHRALSYWALTQVAGQCIMLHSMMLMGIVNHPSPIERATFAIESITLAVNTAFVVFQTIPLKNQQEETPLSPTLQVNESGTSAIGQMFFFWLLPVLRFGSNKEITANDLVDVVTIPSATFTSAKDMRAPLSLHNILLDLSTPFFANASLATILSLILAAVKLCQPLIIRSIVDYLQHGEHYSVGSWLIAAIFFDFIAVALIDAQMGQRISQLTNRFRAYLIQRIFRQAMSIDPQKSSNSPCSRAMVLISVDTIKIQSAVGLLFQCLSTLVIVAIGGYALHRIIGIAFLGPLLLALIATTAPFLLGPIIQKAQIDAMESTERRMAGIKALAGNARAGRIEGMEDIVLQEVQLNRQLELNQMAACRKLEVGVLIIGSSVSGLSILVAFGFFPLAKQGQPLNYSDLFTSLSILSIMVSPLISLVQMVPNIFAGWASWTRVSRYLSLTSSPNPGNNTENSTIHTTTRGIEMTDTIISKKHHSLVRYIDVSLQWNDVPFLTEINLTVTPGELILIFGSPGSGKSSFLKSLLQNSRVCVVKGQCDIKTMRIAYCAQTPWFLPRLSIRENITLCREFNQEQYDTVIDCCCLRDDFIQFENGDMKEITDNDGTGLSGGQRKRVALARALYNDPELCVLDDAFAGIDAKTQAAIESKIFGPQGYGRNMTYIMVSSNISGFLQRQSTQIHQTDRNKLVARKLPSDDDQNTTESEIRKHIRKSIETQHDNTGNDSTDTQPLTTNNNTQQDNTIVGHDKITKRQEYATYFRDLGIPAVIFVTLFTLVFVGIEKGSPFWLSHWAGQYMKGTPDRSSSYYIGIYSAIVISQVLVLFVTFWVYLVRVVPQSGMVIHDRMLKAFQASPVSSKEKTSPEIINRFTKDIEQVDTGLPLALSNILFALVSVLGSFIILAIPAPYTLALVVWLLPLLYFTKRFYLPTSSALRKLHISAQAPMLGTLNSSMAGRETIASYGLSSRIDKTMTKMVYEGQRPGYLFASLQRWLLLVLSLFNVVITTVLVSILVGLKRNNWSNIDIGWAGIALVNTVSMGNDFMLLLHWWVNLEASMASIHRIMDYVRINTNPTIKNQQKMPIYNRAIDVEVRDLQLSYGSKTVVENVSFSIPAGEKIAILGRTGSGKTSLMQSFFQLVDITQGSILLNGTSIASIANTELQKCIVGQAQHSFFDDTKTVRQNIDPRGVQPTGIIEQTLARFLDREASGYICSMLDTKLSECNLSQGWHQRLALARTLLPNDAGLYILDEPTKGMDQEGHLTALQSALEVLHEKTVLIVTHHLESIDLFDRVVILDQGKVAEIGKPSRLLKNNSSVLSGFMKAGLESQE